MKLHKDTEVVLIEAIGRASEYLEMLPDLPARLAFITRMLAGIVAKERGNSEYLQRRINALEKRDLACCAKNTQY